MKRVYFLFVATAFVLNLVLILVGSGTQAFLVNILIVAGCLYVGLPLSILSAVLFSVSIRKPEGIIRRVSIWGFILVLLVFSSLTSLPVRNYILNCRISQAKSYCEALIPKLEAWKKEHGSYPKSISKVGAPDKLPMLLDSGFYNSDGQNFYFDFVHPAGMMNGFEYSSHNHKWYEWD